MEMAKEIAITAILYLVCILVILNIVIAIFTIGAKYNEILLNEKLNRYSDTLQEIIVTNQKRIDSFYE